ncbi:unnamed protein product [Haemonchus placei]|uniref:CCHC-type domain-containing protein n=1 Tax=Haemonchus placei TaxID=6290 RepID=A0A0N4WDY3_HAEPC|nr:unnamed protein product [Haemonchus placei]
MEQEQQTREEEAYGSYTEAAWESITSAETTIAKMKEEEVEISNTLESFQRATSRRIQLNGANDTQAVLSRESRQVGEARQTAAHFEVIEENYLIVNDLLKKKYGSNSLIVGELLAQLKEIRADGSSTRQQANLLERITALLMQLSTKGQNINHRLISNMVLRKFNGDIQAKALEKRENLEDINQWTWSTLRQHLSVIIDSKERIERSQEAMRRNTQLVKDRTSLNRSAAACIYCKRSNHRSIDCRTVPLQERAAFLTRKQMCHNCGKPNHKAEDCRSPGCFKCGRKHHSSLCSYNQQTQSRSTPTQESVSQPTNPSLPRSQAQSSGTQRQSRLRTQGTARQVSQNVITSEREKRDSSPEEDSQILLGCDHLWEMMEGKECKLPSGMHVIDTKFGHMVSGRQTTQKPEGDCNVQQLHEEVDTWDNYWRMESSGIDEYTGPEKVERQNDEEKVMKRFKETIVKKDDGYYVRLPWKDKHPRLPDNKSIAMARLKSLFKQYNQQPQLLQKFQKTSAMKLRRTMAKNAQIHPKVIIPPTVGNKKKNH